SNVSANQPLVMILGASVINRPSSAASVNSQSRNVLIFGTLAVTLGQTDPVGLLRPQRDIAVAGFFAAVAAGFCDYAAMLVHAVFRVWDAPSSTRKQFTLQICSPRHLRTPRVANSPASLAIVLYWQSP